VTQPGDPDRPFAFRPAEVTVPVGSTVRWTNRDDVFHTVTSTDSLRPRQPNGLFDKSLFAKGQTFSFRFTKPGVYHFYCRPHSDFMFGTVRVTQ
jgi:plastocyanin